MGGALESDGWGFCLIGGALESDGWGFQSDPPCSQVHAAPRRVVRLRGGTPSRLLYYSRPRVE